ncbi:MULTISPECIES: glycosyltransferase family 2 protein [unclassified Ensifer]|uniref:glycosyltransferase family 2 protein n=1 Tax=unclassified Ensifer TaxID=2633371 RepID=UPI00301019C6
MTPIGEFVVEVNVASFKQLLIDVLPNEFDSVAVSEVRAIMVRVAIGVVLYKTSKGDLFALLNSVRNQYGYGDAELVVLVKSNDGTTYDRELDEFNADSSGRQPVRILGSVDNCGFGAGHNRLIEHAEEMGATYYIGCNPDGRLHHSAIGRFLDATEQNSKDTLFEFLQFPEEHPKGYDHFDGKTRWVAGACFAARVDFLTRVGGFDENIRMYCEDVDLSWRVLAEGGECVVLSRCLFYHDMTDRRDRQSVRIEMLKSGRYLGWKWRNEGFQKIMEDELVRIGVADEARTLPTLSGLQVNYPIERIEAITEFRRAFSFSPTRW